MSNKYDSLEKITNWIKNSSSEEFMSKFNKLGDNYSGITIGEFIDSFIDNSDDISSEYDILTTGNFVFDAEETTSDCQNKWEILTPKKDVKLGCFELVDIKDIHITDNKQKCTDLYDAKKEDIYSLAA